MTPTEKHALRAVADFGEAVGEMLDYLEVPSPVRRWFDEKAKDMLAAVRAVEQEDGSR